jgi:hypothetical protein
MLDDMRIIFILGVLKNETVPPIIFCSGFYFDDWNISMCTQNRYSGDVTSKCH